MAGIRAGFRKLGDGESRLLAEMSGNLDRKQFESLKLEIGVLAKKYQLKSRKFELKKVEA